MKESKEHETPIEGQSGAANGLVKDVGEVLVSTLRVGASLTRLVAKSTTHGSMEEAPRDAEPVAAMVHYGSVTLKNVFGMVANGVQFLKVPVAPSAADSTPVASCASTHPAPIGKPRVHQGATLRVPLSIENPRDQALGPIVFQTRDLQCLGDGASGVPLVGKSVRFAPAQLTIQPRDFEKLTVFIDVPADAAPGVYRAFIGSDANNFNATIEFEVMLA